ncbi:MAG: hypothetical protein OZ921_15320 [Sorangiineae bacterium]|nr:hypothetical protein [Polyangiaceae bacterium]MEB2323881.1 hypothetical protein [Sorangiineae bacterium]
MRPFQEIENERNAARVEHYGAREKRIAKARAIFDAEERAAREACEATVSKLDAEHDAEIERRRLQLRKDKLAACVDVWKAHIGGTELPRAFADRARVALALLEANGNESIGPHAAREVHPWHAAARIALGMPAPAPAQWQHFRELELEKAIRTGTPSEIVAAFERVEKAITKSTAA